MARGEDEAQCGRMWLRLNAQQTTELTPDEFRDQNIARDVARAIAERHF